MSGASDALARSVLLGPDAVARAAARLGGGDARQRWMLLQPRSIRASFAREVLDEPDQERAAQIWLLRQPSEIRESYIHDVLEGGR